MAEGTRETKVLARVTQTPELARAVPYLRPEVLHAVITHCGLQDCGELLVLATPEQLTAVFDLDLWKAERAGGDEQFDAGRFCEWLEVLVDAGPEIAADRLAKMDVALVVAGLSPNIKVFDLGVFSADGEPSGADAVLNAGRERGVHAEIGGFVVVARRTHAWDEIVAVLLALAEHQPDTFHRVMRACRRLTNDGWELDGLDDLLSDAEQERFDLSLSREERHDRLGFLPPQQARAFLDAARRAPLAGATPQADLIFTAYQRAPAVSNEATSEPLTMATSKTADEAPVATGSEVAAVMDVLRGAGILAEAPRALLPSAQAASLHPALDRYLDLCIESGDDAWTARNQELAFLANALVAGCSVQGRPFSRREAMDAVAATCNLGLERWPQQWPASPQPDLVAIFRVGWTVLHREVSIAAVAQLLAALDQIRTGDADLEFGLHVLRRELRRARQAGTPWRVRAQLDVLATLDLPAWAALTALLDECPVMLANVRPVAERRPHSIDPAHFHFIADRGDIAAVEEFLATLAKLFAS